MPRLTLHRVVTTARLLLVPVSLLALVVSAGVMAFSPWALAGVVYGVIVLANAAFPGRTATEVAAGTACLFGVGWVLGIRHDAELPRLMTIVCSGIVASLPFLIRDFQQLAYHHRHMGLGELRVVAGRQASPRRSPARAKPVVALLPDLRERGDVGDGSAPSASNDGPDPSYG